MTNVIFACSSSLVMSHPLIRALPELGEKSPVSMLIVVVLPAPLCPSRAVISPLYALKVTLSTATTVFIPLNTFLRPCTWSEVGGKMLDFENIQVNHLQL